MIETAAVLFKAWPVMDASALLLGVSLILGLVAVIAEVMNE
jgi:hypothetical protein